MIYLDNAATTVQKPQCVIEAVTNAMRTMGNSSRGAHASSLDASREIFNTRQKLADFFGCASPKGVVFAANATEALNIAIHGSIGEKDHVISTDLEHNSVLRPLYRLKQERDVAVEFVTSDASGNVRYEEFEKRMRPETKAIVCTHGSNLTGNLVDIKRVGAIAKKHGVLLIADASQTAGSIPIHIQEMGIDILCFTGHKGLLGPQGTGGLCVRTGVELLPWKVGGSGIKTFQKDHPAQMPVRLEAGTLNGHGIAGLSAAVDYICEQKVSAIHQREMALTKRFYQRIKEISGIQVYGDFSADRLPIVSLNIGTMDAGRVADILSLEYGIATRAGGHCAPRMHMALGTQEQGAVRFSFSYFTTEAEVDLATQAVEEIAEGHA